MPRAEEPRVAVRMSDSDYRIIEAAASSVNVAVAALMRECAVRYAGTVARDVASGSLTLRRQRVDAAIVAAEGQVVRASSLRVEGDAGWSRQQRVNALGRAKKPPARGGRS